MPDSMHMWHCKNLACIDAQQHSAQLSHSHPKITQVFGALQPEENASIDQPMRACVYNGK